MFWIEKMRIIYFFSTVNNLSCLGHGRLHFEFYRFFWGGFFDKNSQVSFQDLEITIFTIF